MKLDKQQSNCTVPDPYEVSRLPVEKYYKCAHIRIPSDDELYTDT